MRQFILLICGVVFSLQLAAEQTIYGGLMVKRVAVVVADIDRSLELYRDILGFQIVQDQPMDQSPFNYAVFNAKPGTLKRTVKFSTGPEQQRVLGLFEVEGYPGKDENDINDLGLAVRVDNYGDVIKGLRAGDYRIIGEEPLYTPEGDTGEEVAFLDHDGHMLVAYQLNEPAE